MKKIIILFSVVLFQVMNGYSQDKGYVAISIGPSIPTGNFASTDIDNEFSAFAKTGAIFDISFAYKLGKEFGLTAMFRGQSNSVDNQAMMNELELSVPYASWNVESTNWSIGGFMFGGYGSFPIGQGKTCFDARAMIGFVSATSPDITISGSYGPYNNAWSKLNSASATTASYLIGAGFKFNVGARICLLTNLDYMGATPEFENVKTTTSFGSTSVDTYMQSYGTINFSFGVGYRL